MKRHLEIAKRRYLHGDVADAADVLRVARPGEYEAIKAACERGQFFFYDSLKDAFIVFTADTVKPWPGDFRHLKMQFKQAGVGKKSASPMFRRPSDAWNVFVGHPDMRMSNSALAAALESRPELAIGTTNAWRSI